MSANPYESSSRSIRQLSAVGWYAWGHRAYWVVWTGGTALIVLSWVDVVSPTVGWTGFAIAGAATLVSYVLPRFVRYDVEDWAVLTTRMVESKDNGYYVAMKRFCEGATILYEGTGFAFRPTDEIACAAVASAPIEQLDDLLARQDAERARMVFDSLRKSSVEFASSVAGKTFRVSLMSEFGANAEELCRVVDDQIEWMVKAKQNEAHDAV